MKSRALELDTPCAGWEDNQWFLGLPSEVLPANQLKSLPKSSLPFTAFGGPDRSPGHSLDSLQECKTPLALSRDIKEGYLTLDIKLISCQDLTQPRVTTIDVSKPYKKNKHVWCKESFVFDVRLNYAPCLRSDTGCDCLLGGRVEACRVSNWNVREGQRIAYLNMAINLELEKTPLSFSILISLFSFNPMEPNSSFCVSCFWMLGVTYLSVFPREQTCCLTRA